MENSIRIEEQAAAWLVKLEGGEWSDSDQTDFDQWRASTAHRVAFIRLQGAWRRSERLKALGAGTPRDTVPDAKDWQQSPFFGRRMPVTELAATTPRMSAPDSSRSVETSGIDAPRKIKRNSLRAVAAILFVTVATATAWLLRPAGHDYRTPVGGLASVPLSDGSKITLNTDSEIRVDVTLNERHIALEQGEAFFDVAKDPNRPFVVEAGHQRVIAVGTRFSVRRDTNEIRVAVTEGQVRVERDRAEAEPPAHLRAGTVARVGDEGIVLQEKPLPEVEETLSWRTGYLAFHETAIADAVAEFNRYNTRKIVIQGPEVAALKFSGNLRATNIEGFVRLLESGFPVSARRDGDTIVLTKN